MKIIFYELFILTILYQSKGTLEWPTHTICNTEELELYYKSCDPLQDVGLSISPCLKNMPEYIDLKVAVMLRQAVPELYFDFDLYMVTQKAQLKLLSYSYPLCEPSYEKFTFCGSKKGELLIFEGPARVSKVTLLSGQYLAPLRLYNKDNFTIACVNITLIAK
ncbi:lymphocyte antigen 86 [Protopterus annectens]|uniref:lymphocyte antigen 86 n=1 Tax=Protopterus annectens TaxID=7888 RepID=UPI001CFBEE3F|nr:lymphocyte antigen 86 [Protopterus annectens]